MAVSAKRKRSPKKAARAKKKKAKKPTRRLGRPTKLTATVQNKIVKALRMGNYAEVAAAYAGVSERTFYGWLERGERAKELAMGKIREILRLKWVLQQSNREIARSLDVSTGTVNRTVTLASERSLDWATVESMSDEQLDTLLSGSLLERVPSAEKPFLQFLQAVKQAQAEAEVKAVELITLAGQKTFKALAWRLERKFPERWGRRSRHEITGADGGPVEMRTWLDLYKELVQEADRDEG